MMIEYYYYDCNDENYAAFDDNDGNMQRCLSYFAASYVNLEFLSLL